MGLFDRFSKKNKSEETETPQDTNFNPDDWLWGSFLMNEAKFRHQQVLVKRSSKDEPIALGYIIKELLNISPTDIGSMTIVSRGEFGRTEKTEVVESQSDVLAFKPYDALLYLNKKQMIIMDGKDFYYLNNTFDWNDDGTLEKKGDSILSSFRISSPKASDK